MSKMESPRNVGLVCPEHSPKPGKFKGQDPTIFLGKYVKLGFTTKQGPIEHMWVKVERLGDQTQLEGVLNNDPVYDTEYKCGEEIGFDVEEIEESHNLV